MASKRRNGKNAVEEALAGATERVLKQITDVRKYLALVLKRSLLDIVTLIHPPCSSMMWALVQRLVQLAWRESQTAPYWVYPWGGRERRSRCVVISSMLPWGSLVIMVVDCLSLNVHNCRSWSLETIQQENQASSTGISERAFKRLWV